MQIYNIFVIYSSGNRMENANKISLWVWGRRRSCAGLVAGMFLLMFLGTWCVCQGRGNKLSEIL